jgi:two-component system, OmpR family, response regulator
VTVRRFQVRVLLVAQSPSIRASVLADLPNRGYTVDCVDDDKTAASRATMQTYDAILLESASSTAAGFDLLRTVRGAANATAVIVLTVLDSIGNRVRALNEGADDYVAHPFDMLELEARLRAVLRRRGGHVLPSMTNGNLTLDPSTREVTSRQLTTRLSVREFALLQALMLRPGTILSRSELEDRIYGMNDEIESNAVEFLIHSIRRKLGAAAIENVRGAGWRVSAHT